MNPAAPSPGAYAGHQMIELERLGACPAECRGRIVRQQATWRPSFAFGLERSWRSVAHERLTLPLRRTFQVGHFAQSSSASL